MNWAHLHLLLNHIPTVGSGFAAAIFVVALWRDSDALRRLGLEAFFLIALATIPVYMSGIAAQAEIQGMAGISNPVIESHEDAAALAFAFVLLTGMVAWLALWWTRRAGSYNDGLSKTVLVLAVAGLAVSARAANIGGEIRHPEASFVASATPATSDSPVVETWLSANRIGRLTADLTWLWPASETLHFIGMWLLFGVVLIVNCRLLGVMKAVPFSAVHRLLPWAGLGFALNVITGMLFVSAAPDQYALNPSFHLKLAALLIAGVNLLYVTACDGPWAVKDEYEIPTPVKVAAASSILSWVGVMYFGRMLAFIGEAF